ncbi:PREP1 [Symbiodinium sp. CCMP2592]|nr:PREP1 [Symbiodinium sp. CCMP2592]
MSDGESSDLSDGASIKVNCLDCGKLCSINKAVKFGRRFRDPKCHSAYRWLTTNDPEWQTKSPEEKRETVIANRGQGGRGTARKLVAIHEVEVDKYADSATAAGLMCNVAFLHVAIKFFFTNLVRFKRKGAKWYGWSEERAQQEWDKAVRDKNVKRKTDQYGNLTIAKLAEESDVSGLRIGNKRKIMEKNKHKVGDEEAIENLSTGLAQSRLDVEVKMSAASGLNLLTLNDNTRAGAKAKAKPNKSSKRSREAGAEEDGPPSSSKSRIDPEAKKRLDQLKIDSEVVKVSQKWVGRIKNLNVEASQSLAAAEHFPELSALSDEVGEALEKLALSGPIVPMSPSMKSTRLGMLGDKLQTDRSPEATHALTQCRSKKDLSEWDRRMAGHEGLLKKALTQLDKDIEHHQEQAEKEKAMKEMLEARLEKKKRAMESRKAKGRVAGIKQGKAHEELQSGSGEDSDGSDAVPGQDKNGHGGGKNPGHADNEDTKDQEWRFAQGADALIRNKAVGVDYVSRGSSSDSVTFVNPTMLTSLDLKGFGFDQEVSDAMYKEHVIGSDDEDEHSADDDGDEGKPKNLTYFKSVIASPVDEWTKSLPEVLEKLVAGVDAVQGLLEHDFMPSEWSKVLSGKIQYSGPRHKWMGFSDLLWGRLVWAVGGERVCVGMPLMAFQKDIADASADIGGICTRFAGMSREEIKNSGGFACLVESGDVLVIPPGYLLADVNTGCLEDCPVESEDAPADVFPVLTRDQLMNFDLGVYDAAIRLCTAHRGLCDNFKHGRKMVCHLQQKLNGVKDEIQSPVRGGRAPKFASDPDASVTPETSSLLELKPHDLQLVPWVSDDDDASVQLAVHEALSLVTTAVTNEDSSMCDGLLDCAAVRLERVLNVAGVTIDALNSQAHAILQQTHEDCHKAQELWHQLVERVSHRATASSSTSAHPRPVALSDAPGAHRDYAAFVDASQCEALDKEFDELSQSMTAAPENEPQTPVPKPKLSNTFVDTTQANFDKFFDADLRRQEKEKAQARKLADPPAPTPAPADAPSTKPNKSKPSKPSSAAKSKPSPSVKKASKSPKAKGKSKAKAAPKDKTKEAPTPKGARRKAASK